MRKETDTKQKVLAFLEANNMTYVSGQEIADSLFMTRASVWKAVKALQANGYTIESCTNKGYRLVIDDDVLYKAGVIKYISVKPGNSDEDSQPEASRDSDKPIPKIPEIFVFDELESTNDTARKFELRDFSDLGNIPETVCEGDDLVVISNAQTKGRGRRGRVFHSPKGSGLYMSFLLHPDTEIAQATRITAMAAVAVARAIENVTGISVSIKWVNDIFLGDKKIAGILTEGYTSIEDGSLDYIIVGIGINLFPPKGGFPDDIKKTAGVLFPGGQKEQGLRNRLCGSVISEFLALYQGGSFLDEYRDRSCLIGHYVKIHNFSKNAANGYAKVLGIDDDCKLIVEHENKAIEHLSTGEVSVVKY